MLPPKLPCKVEPLQWAGPEDPLLVETGLVHCASIPPEATPASPAPLVVMVHGWAGDEASMWIFKQTLPSHVAIVTPRAPITLTDGGFAWFNYNGSRSKPVPGSLEKGLLKLERFIENLPCHYPVDPTRLVLMGFSQGAMISNAFVYTNPDRALGVASMAGAFPPIIQGEPHDNWLAGFPVFIAHGTRDDVIPVEAARQARSLYQALGADVTYGEYPAAHKMHNRGMTDLKQWLKLFF
jgi:phospholipase/carboxylesterase